MAQTRSGKLAGKIALVTGGSRGIGAATARALAEAGADVAISYSSSPDSANAVVRDIENTGGRAVAFKADQADAKQVERLVSDVVKKFGKLDILVNNAGVSESGAIDDPKADIAKLDRQYAINVGGVVAAVRAAAKVISDGGRIITVGSCLGERVPFPGIADYSGGKAAVVGYTRGWARDLGSKGITVNVVQPGPINTEMNPEDSEFAKTAKTMIALGRYGKPEEVAALIAFLAGPDAAFITGAAINVDGGINA